LITLPSHIEVRYRLPSRSKAGPSRKVCALSSIFTQGSASIVYRLLREGGKGTALVSSSGPGTVVVTVRVVVVGSTVVVVGAVVVVVGVAVVVASPGHDEAWVAHTPKNTAPARTRATTTVGSRLGSTFFCMNLMALLPCCPHEFRHPNVRGVIRQPRIFLHTAPP